MDIFIKKFNEIKKQLTQKEPVISEDECKVLIERLINITKKRFGEQNEYLTRFEEWNKKSYLFGDDYKKIASIIDLIIDEIELETNKEEIIVKPNIEKQRESEINSIVDTLNKKIFIVHGHNNEIKQSVARVIDKLGLHPIILHEQPNMGMTIIEKFLSNSNVGFAVVLLSGDDIVQKNNSNERKYRARQNVVLELGFFYAKLGRNRVVALVESDKNIELPSDIHGIIYVPYDGDNGKWKFELAKELSNNGYNINSNSIL